MKLFIKLMLFIVVAAVAAPFFIKGQDGKPLFALERFFAPNASLADFSQAADQLPGALSEAVEEGAKPIEVFKWRDEKGLWHYSDNKEQDPAAQSLIVDPNAGVVHFDPAQPDEQGGESRVAEVQRDVSSALPSLTSVPLDKIPHLINDAKNLGKLRQESLDRQQQAIQD